MRKQVGLKLDVGLLERLDGVRGEVSRTAWIEEAISARLEGSHSEGSQDARVAELQSEIKGLRRASELVDQSRAVSASGPPARLSYTQRHRTSAEIKAGLFPVGWDGKRDTDTAS